MCIIGLKGKIFVWDSSSETCKQRYFKDTNYEEQSREEYNYVEFKFVIKRKIMMMKLVSITTDGIPAMFGSKVSWLIITNKHSEDK